MTRLGCVVPFCRCTVRVDRHPGCSEVICAKHWRRVPAATKARYRQVKRRHRAVWRMLYGPMIPPPGRGRVLKAAEALVDATWERCKREAIEIAMGITS